MLVKEIIDISHNTRGIEACGLCEGKPAPRVISVEVDPWAWGARYDQCRVHVGLCEPCSVRATLLDDLDQPIGKAAMSYIKDEEEVGC